MSHKSAYRKAAAAVEKLFDSSAGTARRVIDGSLARKLPTWEIETGHPLLNGKPIKLTLPQNFPAGLPHIHVGVEFFLKIPHVERDGSVCLGVNPQPSDYDNPHEAVERVLRKFLTLLAQCEHPGWLASELQRERLSYWNQFCAVRKKERGARPTAKLNLVSLPDIAVYSAGQAVLYADKGPNQQGRLLIACTGETEPADIAKRHNWHGGSYSAGKALFVAMDETKTWTPNSWPMTEPQLDALVWQLTTGQVSLAKWAREHIRERAHPLVVMLMQKGVVYGYQIFPPSAPIGAHLHIEPLDVDRIDARWGLSRDQNRVAFDGRQNKRVLILGCGSLGGPLLELLARAGVGQLDLIDFEGFEAENCARHTLGLTSLQYSKAKSLATKLTRELPEVSVTAHSADATAWVPENAKPGTYDLVVDCTGESAVRTMLAHCREHSLGFCPVVHAWMEPFCAAAHVVAVLAPNTWPTSGPAEQLINVAAWPEDTKIQLPACNAGFHQYGAADVTQTAGFAVERILAVLDGEVRQSLVWSWVRSRSFFDALPVKVIPRSEVPAGGSRFDATMITRDFLETMGF